MKKYLSLIILIFLVSCTKADVHVFAGQSNMTGYGKVEELTLDDLDNTGIYGWDWRENKWVHDPSPLEHKDVFFADRYLGYNVHKNNVTFGVELHALRTIRKKTGKDQYFVKLAIGGSSLQQWEDIHYQELSTELNTALGFKKVDAFYWMQGETDAINLDTAETYEARLSNFVSRVREDYGNVRFIAGMIADREIVRSDGTIGPRWNYAKTVRKALWDMNKASVISIGGTDDLSVYNGPDNDVNGFNTAHYDGRSIKLLGKKFAISYLYFGNTNTYPELLGDFNKDDDLDILASKPVREEKHFSIMSMNRDYSVTGQYFLHWNL